MSLPMKPTDRAYWMLLDEYTTTPVVHSPNCYICQDPEFARMGLPLCRECPWCKSEGRGQGHVPADDEVCDACGRIDEEWYQQREGDRG